MVKIDPNTNQDYENKNWQRPKRNKRKLGPPTLADRFNRQKEIGFAREARIKEAEEKIKKYLSCFLSKDSEIREKQIADYLNWLKISLISPSLLLDNKDLSVKTTLAGGAGGQNVQKNQTAVIITHQPTGISVRNEEQRDRGENEKAALEILSRKLTTHLELWLMIKRNETLPVKIEERLVLLSKE